MSIDRKTFLRHATLGAAGLVAATRSTAQVPASGAPALAPFDAAHPEGFWRDVRAQYPLKSALAYFNTGGLGPSCRPALDAMQETTRKLQERAEHGHGLFTGARAATAKFLGADVTEIAFVRNATEGNAIVAAGLKLAAGDEVIFESHAHPGGSYPWLQQQRLKGIVVKIFEPSARSAEENLERIRKLMTPRTRAVQISHITAPTGIVMPAVEIGKLCRSRGVWFHVDAAQSVGMVPVSVAELGCDSLATSGHKWLGAPLETGILFVRKDRLDEVQPTLVGAYSGEVDVLPGELKLDKTAVRYEYGTRNSAAAVGLAAAMAFQDQIGRARIAERGRTLAAIVRGGLERVPGVAILTPSRPELSASMVTFRHATVTHDTLFGKLLKDHAIRARPVTEEKLNALRVSTHCFNSPAECEALGRAVAQIVKGA